MKEKRLLELISEIDDNFVEEAAPMPNEGRSYALRTIGLAASVIFALFISADLLNKQKELTQHSLASAPGYTENAPQFAVNSENAGKDIDGFAESADEDIDSFAEITEDGADSFAEITEDGADSFAENEPAADEEINEKPLDDTAEQRSVTNSLSSAQQQDTKQNAADAQNSFVSEQSESKTETNIAAYDSGNTVVSEETAPEVSVRTEDALDDTAEQKSVTSSASASEKQDREQYAAGASNFSDSEQRTAKAKTNAEEYDSDIEIFEDEENAVTSTNHGMQHTENGTLIDARDIPQKITDSLKSYICENDLDAPGFAYTVTQVAATDGASTIRYLAEQSYNNKVGGRIMIDADGNITKEENLITLHQ